MIRMQKTRFGPEWGEDGVTFRLFAPDAKTVHLLMNDDGPAELRHDRDGEYRVMVAHAKAGGRYRFLINGELSVPDPASRFQPDDATGASELVDPRTFEWTDEAWQGRPWDEAVIYELHTGSFSPSGDFAGIEARLEALKETGITAIELMPVADFQGKRGWGYDGVLIYAPDSAYGRPEDLKRLINSAHRLGMMVFLDVVYNHFGPEGNYLSRYAKGFFTSHYHTPWGDAVNVEGSRKVRDFFIDNARYWLNEYHFDGLRFDAVHAISDASDKHFLYEMAEAIRVDMRAERHVHLVLENDRNEARYLERDEDGAPRHYTAQWNDDIHHVFHVLLTGETSGYYADYAESPVARLGRCLTQGFDYQGEASAHRKGASRGEPSGHLPPHVFVAFLQNHDQIGNRALGERMAECIAYEPWEFAMSVLLLSPHVPMLFMGEEWGSETPFLYFCDFHGELGEAVKNGRRNEFAGFPEFSGSDALALIPDPNAEETFRRSMIVWEDRGREPYLTRFALVKHLLQIRRTRIVPFLREGILSSQFRRIGECGLEVQWQSRKGRVLQLSANAVAGIMAGFEVTRGEILAGDMNGDALDSWRYRWEIYDAG